MALTGDLDHETRAAPSRRHAANSARSRAQHETLAKSRLAKKMVEDLMVLPPIVRRDILANLPLTDFEATLAASEIALGARYGLWVDTPQGFVEDILGEATWSIQATVLNSLANEDKRQTAVPSCFASSKTRSAACAVAWFVETRPVGTALAVTTAPRFRQVQRLLWPELRALHSRSGILHGDVGATQWKMLDKHGTEVTVAYGFSAPDTDESAVQGIHYANLLWVIDEAGGFSRILGDALVGTFTGAETRGLFIGNPPTDDEDSWFERVCESPDSLTIPIDSHLTPDWTGEKTRRCRSCPSSVPPHPIAKHLVDKGWEARTIRAWGEDAPFYLAKARALFPKGGATRVLPAAWLIASRDAAKEPDPEAMTEVSRDLNGNLYPRQPRRGAFIQLGVDVASDGGDELSISRAEGNIVRHRKSASGPVLANNVDAAGIVLAEIKEAENLRQALGTRGRVRVKVEANGVGWGVIGTLRAWRAEGMHEADIVAVDVSESPDDKGGFDGSTFNPANRRAEMWLAMRAMLQPDGTGAEPAILLDIDETTLAQLGGPKMLTKSDSRTFIESKKDMRSRGLRSPDRGDSSLLAVYTPNPRASKSKILTPG